MNKRSLRQSFVAWLLVAAFVAGLNTAALAQHHRSRYGTQPSYGSQQTADGTVPADTVISVRMDKTLTSKSAHQGDHFTATVATPVYVNAVPVIPAGAIIEGHVSEVVPARRMGRSGVIAVEFDDLVLPDGTRFGLDGTLTSDNAEIRRQIDAENRVSGRDNKRTGVFVGSGGIMGAVLGGIAGGLKGVAVGGAIGAGVGLASVLLAKGEEARVPGGMPFGVQLRRDLAVRPGTSSDPSVASNDPSAYPNRNDNNRPYSSDPAPDDRNNRQPDETQPERQPDRQPVDDRASRQPMDDRSSRQPVDPEPERQPAEPPASSQPADVPPSRQPSDSQPPDNTPDRDANDGAAAAQPSTPEPVAPLPLTAPEMTRRAQSALRDEGYFEGEPSDQWTPRAVASLKTYQKEHKITESGSLDDATAKSLGILGSRPVSNTRPVSQQPQPNLSSHGEIPIVRGDTGLANILSATANRTADGAIYVLINVQANTGGWRWYGDHSVNGDTLEVFARAVRPTGMVTQALTRGKIELNVADGVESVRRVVVHSAGPDQVLMLNGRGPVTTSPRTDTNSSSTAASSSAASADSLFNLAKGIQSRATDLQAEHKRQLGMSSSSDRPDAGGRNAYSDADVELLFALNSFANAANLYAGLIGNLRDSQSQRQATLDLARQARRTDRIIAISTSRDAEPLLPKWDLIRQDVLRLMRMFNISTAEIE